MYRRIIAWQHCNYNIINDRLLRLFILHARIFRPVFKVSVTSLCVLLHIATSSWMRCARDTWNIIKHFILHYWRKQAVWPPGSAGTVCPRPSVTLIFDCLTLKLVCESHSKVGNLRSKFGHARRLASRIIRCVRDGRTDRQSGRPTKRWTDKSNAYCPLHYGRGHNKDMFRIKYYWSHWNMPNMLYKLIEEFWSCDELNQVAPLFWATRYVILWICLQCVSRKRTATIKWRNFTKSQHLLIIFGRDWPGSILKYWCSKTFFKLVLEPAAWLP